MPNDYDKALSSRSSSVETTLDGEFSLKLHLSSSLVINHHINPDSDFRLPDPHEVQIAELRRGELGEFIVELIFSFCMGLKIAMSASLETVLR